MTTEAQVTANRLNAQKSTGPRTAEGKAAVGLNAVKHGLRAQAVVLPGEEPDEYDRYRQRMLEHLQPQDLQEMELAERIVALAWRLRRAGLYHSAVFDALYEQQAAEMAAEAGGLETSDRVLGRMLVADFSGPRVLERVQLYERRIENSLSRARAEWDQRHARPRGPSGQTKPIALEAADAQGAGHTNKPQGASGTAKQEPLMNKQSQWQPPAVGGLGSTWTNKANFGGPVGILADLSAHKRLPARCAM
jgi:hypothetical protein